ncbi:MAG: ATP-binding protein, partial [Pseudomonadota bacterium]
LRLRAEAENGPGGGADGALRVWARIGADGLVVSAEKLSAPERGWAAILLAAALALGASLAFVAHARLARSDARELTDLHESALDDIRAAEANLRASEERFRRLAESTNVIPWSADLDRQRFAYVGPQIEALSGYSAESWRAPGFWTQHIHPADRRRVLSEVVEMSASAGYRTLEYRIRAGNSGVLHVRNMLTVFTENGPKGPRNVAQGFLLDVTEAKIAAAALELARRKAEDANRVKSEFLANMSHELRTPLNAIIGFSEIMKDQVFGPLDDRYQEYAANVHKSGRHLLDLINDILDLSKIEAGRVEIVEEPTDVFELLDECRMLLEEQVQTAGLTCSVTVAQNTPRLSIDMRRIKQVLLNLMSNAIKFTEPGGGLRLSAEIAPAGGVVIAVADDGIGMSPDEIPRALAKFGQIDGELTRKHDGSGLGLPIAKSLIELHGGVFELRSTKGVGTEVRLHLPASRICAEAA